MGETVIFLNWISFLCASMNFSLLLLLFSFFLFAPWRDQSKRMPRSASIDSIVDCVWNDPETTEQTENESDRTTLLAVPSLSSADNRRESLLSPRRTKHARGINGEYLIIYIDQTYRKILSATFLKRSVLNYH